MKLLLFASILISLKFWSSVFISLGWLWAAVEATSFFQEEWEPFIREQWSIFLAIGVVFGLFRSWPKFSVTERISGTDTDIKVIIGDVFSGKNPILVAGTTTFDTNIEDTSISAESVQGQFTLKYFRTQNECKEFVRRELEIVESTETLTNVEKPYGPRKLFSRGELIKVTASKRTAYIFALAKLNQHRTAELNTQAFMDALPIVWDNLRSKGDLGTVNCPLIGAGFSRLNLTKEMILIQIIRSFVAASREGRFLDSLQLFISPKDFEDGRFTLENISRILDFECRYNADMEIDVASPGIDASAAAS